MSINYKKGNSGALVASIVVVLVLLVLGFYSVKERPLKQDGLDQQISDEALNALNTQSASTDINDIENDALNTNLDDLNVDIDTAGGQVQ